METRVKRKLYKKKYRERRETHKEEVFMKNECGRSQKKK